MIKRIKKDEFLLWYKEVFSPTIEGKAPLGAAFLDQFFPEIQDPVTRNWTMDASCFTIILCTYVDTSV
jgi:hypothetical protein